MSKHDYTKHSNKKYNKNADRPKPEFKSSIVEAKTEPEVEIEPVVETVETVEVVESVTVPIGRVVNCEKLDVRGKPSPYSAVICRIPCGAKVTIDLDKSTYLFRKICTEHGIEGYCMKEYIEVEP